MSNENTGVEFSPRADVRLHELESIRGLAALLIVFHHFPAWNIVWFELPVFRNGALMVDLFFVLSGFVVHRAYSSRIRSWSHLFGFQLMRFGRLYPVHLLFLLAFCAVELAKYVAATHYGIVSPNKEILHANDVAGFFQHLFMVQALVPGAPHLLTFNAPSWSIGVEFYTYLLFGLIVMYAKRHSTYVIGTLYVLAGAAILTGDFSANLWFLRCVFGFFLGCQVAVLVKRSSVRVPVGVAELLVLCIVGCMLAKLPIRYSAIAVGILTAGMIFAFARRAAEQQSSLLVKALRTRPLVWLGGVSYTVYMSHNFLTWICNQVIRVVFKVPGAMVGGLNTPQLGVWQAAAVMLGIAGLIVAVSSLISGFIENPAREYFRRKAARFMKMPDASSSAFRQLLQRIYP
ncbi:MAG: acyltransferase [Oxalobacteraceae bacterium]|nr:MAG: acyltransferase [Oxalobacteraceae bacterium]